MPDLARTWLICCKMMLRIWLEISSEVNSPSVPTTSFMNIPGSLTRME